ncbi:MAG TPA: hypothetical protein VJQ83_12000, partial [Tepidiformaceae bacterium]|nr:hypothetical protein [Tepidiformaceae bacterium]
PDARLVKVFSNGAQHYLHRQIAAAPAGYAGAAAAAFPHPQAKSDKVTRQKFISILTIST